MSTLYEVFTKEAAMFAPIITAQAAGKIVALIDTAHALVVS